MCFCPREESSSHQLQVLHHTLGPCLAPTVQTFSRLTGSVGLCDYWELSKIHKEPSSRHSSVFQINVLFKTDSWLFQKEKKKWALFQLHCLISFVLALKAAQIKAVRAHCGPFVVVGTCPSKLKVVHGVVSSSDDGMYMMTGYWQLCLYPPPPQPGGQSETCTVYSSFWGVGWSSTSLWNYSPQKWEWERHTWFLRSGHTASHTDLRAANISHA